MAMRRSKTYYTDFGKYVAVLAALGLLARAPFTVYVGGVVDQSETVRTADRVAEWST